MLGAVVRVPRRDGAVDVRAPRVGDARHLPQTAAPDLANGGLSRVFSTLAQTLLVVSLPFVIAVSGAGLLASVAQVRPRLVLSGLKPDFKRVSPKTGAKRIVSPHSIVELVKSVAKLSDRLGRRARDALAAAATIWHRSARCSRRRR